MPILTIDPIELAHPSRLTCAYLEGLMIWPDDPETRAAAFSTCEREFAKDGLRKIGESDLSITGDVLLAFLDRTSNGPPLDDVQSTARPRFVQGVILSRAIHDMVGASVLGGNCLSREETLKRVCAQVAPKGTIEGQRVTADYLNRNRWDQVKPVLHLWMAYISLSSGTGITPFPCRNTQLPDFLSASEWWLAAAAALRPPRAATGLLNPSVAWRPTADVQALLPAVQISFENRAAPVSTVHLSK